MCTIINNELHMILARIVYWNKLGCIDILLVTMRVVVLVVM
jgi:lipid-A-disaccharide synthase-like uncharacterized protein